MSAQNIYEDVARISGAEGGGWAGWEFTPWSTVV